LFRSGWFRLIYYLQTLNSTFGKFQPDSFKTERLVCFQPDSFKTEKLVCEQPAKEIRPLGMFLRDSFKSERLVCVETGL